MLCDKAGKPLPPRECRLLRAWLGAWFVSGRMLMLVEPTLRQLPPSGSAARKAEIMAWRASDAGMAVTEAIKQQADVADAVSWDVVTEREVVLEGGLQQVTWIHRVAQGLVRVQTQHTTSIT